MKPQTYRQGDVLIQRINQIPKDAKQIRAKGRIILAHGEATGHHHSIDADAADWWKTEDGSQFIEVSESAALVHQEHAEVIIPAGTYRVVRQREYSPEAIRNVAD